MKIKFLHTIVSLLCASFVITSCLDGEYQEVEYSSESSITAFAFDSIVTQYVDYITYGKDTTLSKTVLGTDYPFAIDQGKRLIYNVDSLPVGTDISKVVANISFDGWALYVVASDQDTLWSSTDSLNFENPVKFKAMAMSGVYGYTYTAKINVHQQEPDSLSWSCLGNTLPKGVYAQKAVALDDNIHVFVRWNKGIALTSTSINDGRNWSTLHTLSLPDNADHTSVMAWGNELLILAGNDLYRSTDAENWQKVETETKFSRLIANIHSDNNNKVYAINADNHFIESDDEKGITTWNVKEEVPASFPPSPTAFAVSPLATNNYIERMTVMGNNVHANDSAALVWSRLTSEATWADYMVSEGSQDYCPVMENLGLVYYNNYYYAFGGPAEGQEAFSHFYMSKDQCITWSPVKKWMFFPETFVSLYEQAHGNYSYVVDKNNYLWFIFSESGEVWKARINKMGFADYK